jgi:hypothetical protein
MATVYGESTCGNGGLRVEMTQTQNKKPRRTSTITQETDVLVSKGLSGCKKKASIRKKDVERVKNRLDEIWDDAPENAPFVDNDGEPLWGPVVLSDKVSWKDFDQWLDANEGVVRRWLFEPLPDDIKHGRVIVYSLPSRPHEKTSGKLVVAITDQLYDLGLRGTYELEPSPKCRLGTRRGKEPDMSISPVGLTVGEGILDDGKGFPFPNVVIEVAYKNEPLQSSRENVGLRDIIRNWLSSVQVKIGIKIFTAQSQRYRAILGIRNSPTWEVEFGMKSGTGPIIYVDCRR